MNRILVLILGSILVGMAYLTVRLVSEPAVQPARPLKLATGTWDPFVGPHLEDGGPVAQIVTETIRRMGYEPELHFSSWDVAQHQVRRGDAFGSFPFIRTGDRDSLYEVSDSILTFDYVLFYNRDQLNRETIFREGLRPYRLGIVRGYELWPALTPALSHFAGVDTFETSADAFRDLARGNGIDLLPEGDIAGRVLLDQPELRVDSEAFDYLDAADSSIFGAVEGLHLLLQKDRTGDRFLEAFNRSLTQVKKTSVYRRALSQIRAARAPDVVELRPLSGRRYPLVTSTRRDSASFSVPLGTRALVIEWPAELSSMTGPASVDPSASLCTVKLINGPHRGRVVRVDAQAVSLIP